MPVRVRPQAPNNAMKLIWDTGQTKDIPYGYKIIGQHMHYARPKYISLTREELLGLLDNTDYIKHLAGALASEKQNVTK